MLLPDTAGQNGDTNGLAEAILRANSGTELVGKDAPLIRAGQLTGRKR